jgi:hypothetical protein
MTITEEQIAISTGQASPSSTTWNPSRPMGVSPTNPMILLAALITINRCPPTDRHILELNCVNLYKKFGGDNKWENQQKVNITTRQKDHLHYHRKERTHIVQNENRLQERESTSTTETAGASHCNLAWASVIMAKSNFITSRTTSKYLQHSCHYSTQLSLLHTLLHTTVIAPHNCHCSTQLSLIHTTVITPHSCHYSPYHYSTHHYSP